MDNPLVVRAPLATPRQAPPAPMPGMAPAAAQRPRPVSETMAWTGYTGMWTTFGDEKRRVVAQQIVKESLCCLIVVLVATFVAALIFSFARSRVQDDDDVETLGPPNEIHTRRHTVALPPPTKFTLSSSPAVTTTRPGLVFCTVSETLLVEQPITEGICDYAVFADLLVTEEGFEPTNGRHAWEVFKRGVSKATYTVGGVSFSSVSADSASGGENTLRRLVAMNAELSALTNLHMWAMGTLNFRDKQWAKEPLRAPFQQLRVALKNAQKAVTFLGVWIRTSQEATNFVGAIGNSSYIDLVIVQTHVVPYEGMTDPCVAYTISHRNADGIVPNYDVADKVLDRLRGGPLRVLYSSTLAAVAYVGAKNGADVTYVPSDMAEFVTFRHQDAGYFVTFEGNQSLSNKISSYRNKVDGWAFFDVQRDVYWPCRRGISYERLKQGASLLRLRRPSQ
ncbi:uncharacterized protein [Dermacentor albipictus]|uniref:uncharacterized protein isoform X2 n=1 Tax=Dermacentor albipictus TaxID=60249 RepID=UPI0038FC6E30